MFVTWNELMTFLTDHGVKSNFMETFEHTAIKEKVALCMRNAYIKDCLVRWLDSFEYDDNSKSLAESQKIRFEANQEFKKNQLKVCLKLYTKAAQFAPNQSIELALAFANRSAVYIRLNKFHECLKDIDASLDVFEICKKEFLFDDQLIVKLLKRAIECLKALGLNEKAKISEEKLLMFTKKDDKTPLEDQFIKKCKIVSDHGPNSSTKTENSEKVNEAYQPTICNENLVYKILEKNKITLPYKSPKLKLCNTEAKGRHFVASEKIDYGEILIFENPSAFVLLHEFYDSFCYNCCIQLNDYCVPCNHCTKILFCDTKCRQESWDAYHNLECKQGTSIFQYIGLAHLALRLTFETLRPDCNSDSINGLLTHIDKINTIELYHYSLTATLLLIYLREKTDFFEKNPLLDSISVGNELLYHMARLVCNGNAISTRVLFDDDSASSVVRECQPRIGTAIYPTSSLLNHSCDPNINSSNILKFVVIKAARNIEEGEEITNCYGVSFRRMLIGYRQLSLKDQYHFDCKCCVCTDQRKSDKLSQVMDGLVCLSCKDEIPFTMADLVNIVIVACDKCSAVHNTSDYTIRILKADQLYEKGIEHMKNNYISEAIDMIVGSLRFNSQVMNKKNSVLIKSEDRLAKCFAIIGDFKNCYEHLELCIDGIVERFGENSLEVAYEMDKLSDIMVNKLEIKENRNLIHKALAYIGRSKEIFHANLSAWDIPYNEAVIANIKFKENVLLKFLEDLEKK